MTAQKCVVEGCDLEYDVVCSFSFYNANTSTDNDGKRQEWIDGAMRDESECLWRHVSLQLCGYHFELDNQGLWIDSPMLPELLTLQEKEKAFKQSADDKKRGAAAGFQGLFEKFIGSSRQVTETIRLDHSYSLAPVKDEAPETISRLNVRQLVDTLGYLSMKNLQRKQLWVVKVETDKAEASITQSEQVITKMPDPRQIIEILPQTSQQSDSQQNQSVLAVLEESTIPDNFIYEIAEEQEISMEEVKEIPSGGNQEWVVNILPDDTKPKYAYIKHCSTGKKKRHFTADMNEITLQGDFENYYILPDVDPSVGVEITTTSYEPENYIVEEYEHLMLEERPKKRKTDSEKKKRKKASQVVTSCPGDPSAGAEITTSYVMEAQDLVLEETPRKRRIDSGRKKPNKASAPSPGEASLEADLSNSFEPETYIVQEYEHLVQEERPRKRKTDSEKKRKKVSQLVVQPREEPNMQLSAEEGEDWVIDNNMIYSAEDYEDKKAAARA